MHEGVDSGLFRQRRERRPGQIASVAPARASAAAARLRNAVGDMPGQATALRPATSRVALAIPAPGCGRPARLTSPATTPPSPTRITTRLSFMIAPPLPIPSGMDVVPTDPTLSPPSSLPSHPTLAQVQAWVDTQPSDDALHAGLATLRADPNWRVTLHPLDTGQRVLTLCFAPALAHRRPDRTAPCPPTDAVAPRSKGTPHRTVTPAWPVQPAP